MNILRKKCRIEYNFQCGTIFAFSGWNKNSRIVLSVLMSIKQGHNLLLPDCITVYTVPYNRLIEQLVRKGLITHAHITV